MVFFGSFETFAFVRDIIIGIYDLFIYHLFPLGGVREVFSPGSHGYSVLIDDLANEHAVLVFLYELAVLLVA